MSFGGTVMTRTRSSILLLATGLLGCLTTACTSRTGTIPKPDASWSNKLVVSTAPLGIVPGAIRSPDSTRLVLRTPEGKTFNLVRARQERVGETGVAWHGRLADDPNSSATIVENKGAVAGTIFTRDGVYRLRSAADGRVFIDRID